MLSVNDNWLSLTEPYSLTFSDELILAKINNPTNQEN